MNDYQWNLEPLWQALLEMYQAIRNVCEKHPIRFWAVGGTALGAIRHKGFIPWDDDFDLGMPRPDYERFISVASKDLPKNLGWKSIETDSGYRYQFGKVVERNAEMTEQIRKASNLNLWQGIYIDIFPIDGMPKSRCGLFMFKLFRAFLRRLPVSPLAYQRFISLLSYDGHEYIGVSDADSYKEHRCWWPRQWFRETKMLEFGGTEVPVPGEYIKFIENHYRNWKELPPVEFRHPSHQSLKYVQYL